MRRRQFGAPARPALDSAISIAGASMFLTGARTLDHVSASQLAGMYRLSVKRAECMLLVEQRRRAERGA